MTATKAPEQAIQPVSEINLPDFAEMVIGMSRLLVGLTAWAPFKNAEITLTDWVALSVLAKGAARNNRQLSKILGVTRQRANQIKKSLEDARLISASQSKEDARKNIIAVTDRGYAELATMNSKIISILATSLKDKERVLARTNKSIKILMRIVKRNQGTTGQSEGVARNARRRARDKSDERRQRPA